MAILDGTIGSDNLNGTNEADVISGADSGDTILGRGGDDVLYGFGVADTNPESGTIQVDRIVTGLESSLFAASPPGQPDKLYVLEQFSGKIQVVDLTTNEVAETPFLDLPPGAISNGGEQGLLGLAFDPNYESNGKFYVNITNADGDTEVWRYKRSAADPNVADPDSKKLIIRIDQPFENHNGGWMDFGPDGYLYIAMGDGGSGGDPQENAQDINSLLGKMLRIDVHGDDFTDNEKNYAIPDGNPFVGVDGADEVWALGLRNPWRNSFDTATGDLYIADVGQDAHEEVNFVAAGQGNGANFGWDTREGDFPFEGPDDPSFTDPIIDIPHESGPFGGSTIIGGYVYRGPGGGQGLYFFDDAGSNNFWTTRVVDGEATQYVNIADQLRGDVGSLDAIVSWGLDGTGRLYAVGLDGEIFRITPSATAGDANDTLRGGDGNDTVYGGLGDDRAFGGAGDDTMSGGLGDDLLRGNEGADVLSGNGGNDRFSFAAVADSQRGTADQITDLEDGDTIDLSLIDADTTADGDQAFTLVSSFGGNAGELVVIFNGTNTRVKGDVNGDGAVDFVVSLAGDHSGFENFDF